MILRIFFALVLFFTFPKSLLAVNETIHFDDPTKVWADKVSTLYNKLSLKQKIAQIFIFGFRGTEFHHSLKKTFDSNVPGSLIVFKHNIKKPSQIARLNYQAQKLAIKKTGIPLFIMVDQEGGSVTRIRTKPNAPSAQSLGMTQNPSLSEETGRITGKILSLLGFNMNLAPVVDLSHPLTRDFIGTRSFGSNPFEVRNMSHRFAQGMEQSGILSTFKHFPGHGGIITDSHKKTPMKNESLQSLLQTDLVPFSHFSQTNIPSAIMVAHISFPQIDSSGLPATFSKTLVTDVLKNKMGYSGLILTDDIEMNGAKAFSSVGERAIRAFEAGNDMIMVAWTRRRQKQALRAMLKAVKSGRIKTSQIERAVKKIIAFKLSRRHSIIKPNIKELNAQLKKEIKDLKATANHVSFLNFERATQNYSDLFQKIDSKQKIIVFSADGLFYKSFKQFVKNPVQFYPLLRKRKNAIDLYMAKNKDSIGFYYVTGKGTAKILNTIDDQTSSRLIIINSDSPGLIKRKNRFKAVINVHSKNYHSGEWVGSYFIRQKMPNRRNPASLIKKILPAKKVFN